MPRTRRRSRGSRSQGHISWRVPTPSPSTNHPLRNAAIACRWWSPAIRQRSSSDEKTRAVVPRNARHWQVSRHGVIRFQHRRNISSILFRNTLAPTVIRTAPGNYLEIEGVKSQKIRSCYEYHPLGRSKKVRTAVGRQICAAGPRAPSFENSEYEKHGQRLGVPAKAKRKTGRPEPGW
jgi:hypothetical protein